MKHETFAVLITLGFTACADPGSPKEPDIPGAISAGTSGLGEGGPEGDESGGADDESGEGGGGDGGGDGGGPEINPQDCLLAPVEGRHGYKYWCDGSLELDLEIRGEEGSIALNFGELMGQYAEDPDTYDNPLVMACCGEIAEGQQNCDMPQFNACAFDMVEMGCLSIGPRMQADKPDDLGTVASEQYDKLVEWFNDNTKACASRFLQDTQIAEEYDMHRFSRACDENRNPTFAADEMLIGETWQPDPGILGVSGISLRVSHAEISGVYPHPDWHDAQPTTCESQLDNNHLWARKSELPKVDDELFVLTAGSTSAKLEMFGYTFSARQILDLETSNAKVAWDAGSDFGELRALSLYPVAPTEIQGPGTPAVLQSFRIALDSSVQGRITGDQMTIGAGEATFVVGGLLEGMPVGRVAHNAAPFTVTRGLHGLEISPITLASEAIFGLPQVIIEVGTTPWQ